MPQQPSRARRLRDRLARRGALLTWLAGLFSLTAFTHYVHEALPAQAAWVLGLASHFQWCYLAAGACGLLPALLGRRWHALVPGLLLGLSWVSYSPQLAVEAGTEREPTLTVAVANVHFEQQDHRRLQAWLLADNPPDLVVIAEFTPAAQAAVQAAAVRERYPHQLLAPAADQFGLAIVSRLPLSRTLTLEPADRWDTPRLHASAEWQGLSIALSAIHPMPPVSPEFELARDQALVEESQGLMAAGGLGILAGDFNDTPWSTGLRRIVGLHRATGLAPTWPNAGGVFSLLPLDHIALTPGWKLLARGLGPDLGADHRPVVVRIAPAGPR